MKDRRSCLEHMTLSNVHAHILLNYRDVVGVNCAWGSREPRHSSKLHKKKQCASGFTRCSCSLHSFNLLPSIFPSFDPPCSFFLSFPQDCATMQFCANKLDKKDFFGRSDPFMVFYRSNEDGTWVSCLSFSLWFAALSHTGKRVWGLCMSSFPEVMSKKRWRKLFRGLGMSTKIGLANNIHLLLLSIFRLLTAYMQWNCMNEI